MLTRESLRLKVTAIGHGDEAEQAREVLAHVEDLLGRRNDLLRRDDSVPGQVAVIRERVQTRADASLAAVGRAEKTSEREGAGKKIARMKREVGRLTRSDRELGTGGSRPGNDCSRRRWKRLR